MDKSSSTTLKGFFILLIVFSHILNNFAYTGHFSSVLWLFRSIMGQLVVSLFFFISGYGILYSVDKNDDVYSRSLVTNRVLRIIFYMAISLIPYFIYCAWLNKTHPASDYFLAIIGLTSFGNSRWFVFAILVCYFVSSLFFFFHYKHKVIPVLLITVSIVMYIVIFVLLNKSTYEYNTIICFPLGLFTGLYRDKINKLLDKKPLTISLLPISVGVVVLDYYLSRFGLPDLLLMTISNIFFCLFFVCLTKIFTLKSPVLEYLGNASFAIFIMHMFVVNCFVDLGTIPNEWLNYFVLFTTSVLIGIPFYYLYKVIDKYITNPIVKWNRELIDKYRKEPTAEN